MKLLVIGGSQGTGAQVVEQALAKGHEVGAFSRSPEKNPAEHPRLRKLQGDFHNRASVEAAVEGYDAVVVTASATSLRAFKENPHYFSEGTKHVVAAMRSRGVRRLVILSALGVAESRSLVSFPVRTIFVDGLLKNAFVDHERQENLVRDSGLEWVVARPGRLTNGPARRRYKKTRAIEKVPSSMSRGDVADFLLEAATSDEWVGQAVQIGG